ncbi:MAG: tripartite tricarboxylate transporter substrate binding protein [Burkholderiales bacterium]|jgi:tripartite-type tricarboxylate transporter receptor subunit TctC|nr:tripartite tricarboxylate transporter substrate binding protein [Burkholderiales bacterium]MBP7520387.1 tripartite tricarboxylate transporter substrate binding protein [Leptothrix sp. (in: b-proteobacteria)]HQY07316.1 tripartite tricarboxylate transporter substrate binding protein [Burkholderiaceae bacterium]
MQRQHFLRAAVAATVTATLALTTLGAAAQAWPSKPVKFIIPFPPGGTLDTVGRLLAQKLQEQLGQTFIVENRAGGNGMIGSDAVAKAPADGYTLLFNASTFTTTPMTVKSAPYDVLRDFAPVAMVAKAPLAVSVNNNLPVNDIKGLMAYARANPGKLNFAIGSTGSAGNLATELLKRASGSGGIDLTIVPYKGTAPAFQDLVGGQIEGFIDPLLGAMNFHKAGKVKIIAVTSKSRVVTLPDVPTVGETVPGYEFYSWYGVWGPAKLPAEVVTRLNGEVNKALAGDMRERLLSQGLLVGGGSVEDFVKFQRDDMARSQKIITDGNIRAE